MPAVVTVHPLPSVPSSTPLLPSPSPTAYHSEYHVDGSTQNDDLTPSYLRGVLAADSMGQSLLQSQPHTQSQTRPWQKASKEQHQQQRELFYRRHSRHKQKQQLLMDSALWNHPYQQGPQCQVSNDFQQQQRQQGSRVMNWQGHDQECAKIDTVGSEGLPNTPFISTEDTTGMSATKARSIHLPEREPGQEPEPEPEPEQKRGRAHTQEGTKVVRLVDDVWRIIFYILAQDCKDLGRCMQVNRRFHSLIANDALLWKLSYSLTVSGSVFATQKPLLSSSPGARIRENQNQLEDTTTIHHGDITPHGGPRQLPRHYHHQPLSYQDELESPFVSHHHHCSISSPGSVDMDLDPDHEEAQHTGGKLVEVNSGNSTSSSSTSSPSPSGTQSRRGSLSLIPGPQIPSPLISPRHRRIVQTTVSRNIAGFNIATHSNNSSGDSSSNSNNNSNSNSNQRIVDRSVDPESLPFFNPGTTLDHYEDHRHGTTGWTRTPTSTPALLYDVPFRFTLPPNVSQVVPNSTTPLCVIQHHIPTTTLMHHTPAVYWKNQVVEWLEQEKLRCLRLGLFWRFNIEASRMHGRQARR